MLNELASATERKDYGKLQPFGASRNGRISLVNKTLGNLNAPQEFLAFLGLPTGNADTVTDPYTQNEWVWKCIDLKAAAVIGTPIIVRDGIEEDSPIVENPDHPLVKLLRKFNRFYPRAVWERAGVAHWDLDGEDFWFMVDAEARPIEPGEFPEQIFPWRGRIVKADLQQENPGKGWPLNWYIDQEDKFPLESVLHFKSYNPSNPVRGVGAIEVALRKIELQFNTERFEDGLLSNGGHPSVYLMLKNSMSEAMRKEFEEEANDELSRPENAGGVKVLEQGVEPKTVGFSPKDMTNEDRLKRVRDAILAALGVPGPLLGIYEFATLDNFREAKLQFWQQTIIPYQQMRCEVLNGWISELNDNAFNRLRVSYDYSGVRVLQEGNTEKLQAAVSMAQARVGLSFNNAAALLGMDDIDQDLGSDIILEPQEPPDMDGEDDDEEPEDNEKSAAVLKSIASPQPEPELSELRSYYNTLEKRLMIPADGRLKQVLMKFLRSFELAQIRKIGRVAKNGPDPEDLAKGYVVKDARDITPEIIEKILLLAAESWKLKLSKAAKSELASIYKGALFQAASELGVTSLPLADPQIVEALAQQLFQLSGVVDTLREQIKAKMVEVFAQGATIGDLQQSIQGLVPELKKGVKDVLKARASRALVIARNETGNAINRARWEQMKEAGVTHIQWITSADDAVRDSHRAIDGDIVSFGVPFENGLKYPHDPAGPLDEVIQCRCTIRKAKKQEAAA